MPIMHWSLCRSMGQQLKCFICMRLGKQETVHLSRHGFFLQFSALSLCIGWLLGLLSATWKTVWLNSFWMFTMAARRSWTCDTRWEKLQWASTNLQGHFVALGMSRVELCVLIVLYIEENGVNLWDVSDKYRFWKRSLRGVMIVCGWDRDYLIAHTSAPSLLDWMKIWKRDNCQFSGGKI